MGTGWPQQVFDFSAGYQVFKTRFSRFFPKKSGHLAGFLAFFSKNAGFGRFYCKKAGFYFSFSPTPRDNFSAYLVSIIN